MLLYKLCLVLVLVLISPCFDNANAGALKRYRRSFLDELDCPNTHLIAGKSVVAAARLDRVCYDCFDLFQEPFILGQCRKNCFTTKYFQGCAETLMKDEEEMKQYQNYILMINPFEI